MTIIKSKLGVTSRIFASLTMGRIRFSSRFSKNFDLIERRLIGLYEEGKHGGLLGFRIIMMVEYHHKLRN